MSPILGRLDPALPNVAALRPLVIRHFAIAVNPVKNGRVQNRDFLRPAGVRRVSRRTGSIGAPRFGVYRIKRVPHFRASLQCLKSEPAGLVWYGLRSVVGSCGLLSPILD